MKTWVVEHKLLVGIVVVLLFLFDWPGVWRYQYDLMGPMHGNACRIDRLTGIPYAWEMGKWVVIQ